MTKDVTKNIDIKRYISWKKIVKGKPIHIRLYELVYKAQLAMNLGETYLVTETGNERLGNQKLDLVVL